jgi:hypothetical protein
MLGASQLPWQKVPQITSSLVVLFILKLINSTLSFKNSGIFFFLKGTQ